MTVYSKKTKKGIRWYYQLMHHGDYLRGGGYRTRRDAVDAETEERRITSAPQTDMDFWTLGQQYLDYIQDRKQSYQWYNEKKKFIKNKLTGWYHRQINTISRAEIERIMLTRSRSSPYMANKELKFLKAIFNYAISQGFLEKNPCNGIERVATERRVRTLPTVADFNKVLLAANPIEQRLLTLLLTTLARQTEILDLKRSDDHGDYIILRTRKHKGGAIREDKIPVGPKARMALDWLKEHCPPNAGDFFFFNRRTNTRYTRRPKLMRSLCKKAGVKPFGFHDIRALGASVMALENVPLKYISSRLRHLKTSTTELYLHTIDEGERLAANVLDGAIQ
jgi:integrase